MNYRLNYRAGRLHGLSESFYIDGTRRQRTDYFENQRHGLQEEYHPNGRLERQIEFKRGVEHGSFVQLDQQGQQLETGRFVFRLREGVWEERWPNGHLRERATYLDGRREGDVEVFHGNGRPAGGICFTRGVPQDFDKPWFMPLLKDG